MFNVVETVRKIQEREESIRSKRGTTRCAKRLGLMVDVGIVELYAGLRAMMMHKSCMVLIHFFQSRRAASWADGMDARSDGLGGWKNWGRLYLRITV
jgi:hypothetical protein